MSAVQQWIMRRLVAAPEWLRKPLAGPFKKPVNGRELDPQLQMLCSLSRAAPSLDQMSVDDARQNFETMAHYLALPAQPSVNTHDRIITCESLAIPVRWYEPAAAQGPLPLILYFHGGGWVVGNRNSHDTLCQWLCESTRCMVMSVDYRLGPERPYPAAVEDAAAAYRWCLDYAHEVNVDPAKIIIAGDSAGGNLAAVVSLIAKQKEWPLPLLQCLIYPVTDVSKESQSYDDFADGYVLTRDLMRWFINHYIPNDAERAEPNASPLLAEDLSGLPPALVATAGFDVLRDEGDAYAERLKQAGVEVMHLNQDSMTHGYVSFAGYITGARRALEEIVAVIKTRL